MNLFRKTLGMKGLKEALTLKTVEGQPFQIPLGKWKHIKKSFEWERSYKNEAKNLVGKFSASGKSMLRWDSLDGSITMLAEVKEIRSNGTMLYVRHRSGLEYWYTKE